MKLFREGLPEKGFWWKELFLEEWKKIWTPVRIRLVAVISVLMYVSFLSPIVRRLRVADGTEAFQEYEGSNEVAAQILKLPVKLRNVLLLKYVHGYHYAEIGEIMGITGEDAKKTGQRAKAKLEELCREEGIL